MWRVAGELEQAGGAGGAELAKDGSQRVYGARTDPLSLSRTHVSLTSTAFMLSVLSGNGQTEAIKLIKKLSIMKNYLSCSSGFCVALECNDLFTHGFTLASHAT